jgi:competence protein ComEC
VTGRRPAAPHHDADPPGEAGQPGEPGEPEESTPTAAVLGPLPSWAAAAVLGAVAGEGAGHAGLAAGALALAAGAGLLVAVALAVRRAPATAWHGPGAWQRGAVAWLAVLLVAVGAAGLRVDTLGQGLLPHLAAQGGEAVLEARVVEEPRPVADGWHVDLRVVRMNGEPIRERAATTLDGTPPGLGERWWLRASARPPPEGGYGRWLTRRHVRAVLDVRAMERVGDPGVLARSSERVRHRIRTAATARTPEAVGGLLAGIVIGDTRLLPEADAEAMRATSLTHLTAVSGSHTAIVVAGVLGVCAAARLGARGRRRAVVATLGVFAYLTRFEPSVLRAGTMAMLVVLAFARGVPRDARHALAGTVLLLVLVDPLLAGSLGLLLSAVATAGVLAIAPQVRERLSGRRWLPRRVADVLAITLGAQVAVVPLLLPTFGEVGLSSVPANLLAVPAAAVAAGLGFVGALVAIVHVEAAGVVFALAGVPARLVLAVARGLAGVGGVVETARPVGVVALVCGCAWLCTRPRTRTAGVLAVVTLVGVSAAGLPGLVGRSAPDTLTVTAVDVGQGDAFLVESPGARLLVDAGEDGTAARWLRAQGRPSIDVAVVTHPHLDHVGGMHEVLRHVEVGELWYRPMPNRLEEVEEMLLVAEEDGIPVRAPVAGRQTVVGDLRVEVLGPPPGRPYRFAGSELNESSLVLRVDWEGRRVLLTGDVELAAQADLLERPQLLEAEAMTVPHHGGATTDPAFLEAVGAQVALIGVGADNRHGHPHPAVLGVLDALGVVVQRTDRDGDVTVAVPAPVPERALGADASPPAPPEGASMPRRHAQRGGRMRVRSRPEASRLDVSSSDGLGSPDRSRGHRVRQGDEDMPWGRRRDVWGCPAPRCWRHWRSGAAAPTGRREGPPLMVVPGSAVVRRSLWPCRSRPRPGSPLRPRPRPPSRSRRRSTGSGGSAPGTHRTR